MKSLLTLATALALSCSFAVAQHNDNGLNLGKSMPGSTAGVPYPDRAATDNAAPVAGGGATQRSPSSAPQASSDVNGDIHAS
jgi:hypothetical protein